VVLGIRLTVTLPYRKKGPPPVFETVERPTPPKYRFDPPAGSFRIPDLGVNFEMPIWPNRDRYGWFSRPKWPYDISRDTINLSDGERSVIHRSRHCLPLRVGICFAINAHFFCPCLVRRITRRSSSSFVHCTHRSVDQPVTVSKRKKVTREHSVNGRSFLFFRSLATIPFCETRSLPKSSREIVVLNKTRKGQKGRNKN